MEIFLSVIGFFVAGGITAFVVIALEFYRTYLKFVRAQESCLRTSEQALREGMRLSDHQKEWYEVSAQEIRNREEALETCDMKLRQGANFAQHVKALGPYYGEDE